MKIARGSLFVVATFFLMGTLLTGCGGGAQSPTASIERPKNGDAFSVNQLVEFKGLAKDSAGKEVTKDVVYEWDFGDGQKGTGQSASRAYAQAGSYTVKLTVKTAAQAKESNPQLEAKQTASITITVSQALTVTIKPSVTEGPAPLEVTFTAAVQGTAASYNWDFGDGQMSTDASPTHKFEKDGSYTVKVAVTDSSGASASAQTTITVKPGETPKGQGAVHIVKMVTTKDGKNFFDPVEITIKLGDTIRWVNECEEGVACVHSAQAYPDKIPAGAEVFDSTLLTAQGMKYEHAFKVAGTYEYFCLPHEALGQKGKITVTP